MQQLLEVAPALCAQRNDLALIGAVREGLAQPEAKAAMDKQDLEATPSTPEELATLVRTELVKWAKVIKAAGIRAQ